ncbi:purple acid phosphatase family protein [Sinomicrobium soli]|uniref:purple acid phosphatase family protein n=1 Tax=Sinomicrobium sp. N-1-3-6 TaxID=2219864 RepID=UPI000DCED839|nr:metallophosphoesterase family protein [Sinomicrobium sp. N-1-3-6]RAV31010.1 metallophosphoesterase [Sinomicrobium sp. N-1-3-6]
MNPSNTKNGRRAFIGNVGRMAALSCIPVPFESVREAARQAGENTGFVPYLQNLTPEGVTVMFISGHPAQSWVEYGTDQTDRKAQTGTDGLLQAGNPLNKIRLTGLKPGMSYRYRIASRAIRTFEPYKQEFGPVEYSETYEFSTPDPGADQVSCVILNDIHDRPYSFKDLMSVNPDFPYEFVVLNGDMFNYQTGQQQLQEHLINPCSAIFAREKPFLMLRGNHETRGKFARNIKEYFDYDSGEYYFSFRQGPVHFIVLDSGEDKEDDHPEYHGLVAFDPYREQQAVWLDQELEQVRASGARYCVVLMHIPPYHSGDWHGTMHCRKLFGPLFEKYKVDMVISGHTHRWGIHPPDNDHGYPIVIGGGPKTGSRTKIELSAGLQQLRVAMYNDKGEQVGSYTVS